MIKVNLVPAEILKKEEQRRQMVLVGIGAGFLAVIFAGISFMHFHKRILYLNLLPYMCQDEKEQRREK